MKNVAYIRWLSKLDMEPLLGFVLIVGVSLSVTLVMAGFWIALFLEKVPAEYQIQAISIPRLLIFDLSRHGKPDFWSRLLMDSGFVVLLITPYARLFVTWLYLVFVKRQWKNVICTSLALIFLSVILFFDVVVLMIPGRICPYSFNRPQVSAQQSLRPGP
jgi:uncharacterized membrane protein